MEFSKQEYWSGLPFPSPGDLPNPGIKPRPGIEPGSPALQAGAYRLSPQGSHLCVVICYYFHTAKTELINETKTLWCTNPKYSLTEPVGETSAQQAKHRQCWILAPLSSSTALPCVGFTTTLQGTFDKRHAQEWQRLGTSLVVQWLGLWASTAGGVGLIPGWGTKIPHAAWHDQKLKNKYKF